MVDILTAFSDSPLLFIAWTRWIKTIEVSNGTLPNDCTVLRAISFNLAEVKVVNILVLQLQPWFCLKASPVDIIKAVVNFGPGLLSFSFRVIEIGLSCLVSGSCRKVGCYEEVIVDSYLEMFGKVRVNGWWSSHNRQPRLLTSVVDEENCCSFVEFNGAFPSSIF